MTTIHSHIAEIERALEGATPGRWCQFRPQFAPEAEGTPFCTWDTSHDVSAVADGKKTKNIGTLTHAADAAFVEAARNHLPAILEYLKQVEGERDASDEARKELIEAIWQDATNSVCQAMQSAGMCNCPDGECLAATVDPSQEDYKAFSATLAKMEAGVVVKPLDWRSDGGGKLIRADTIVGQYCAHPGFEMDGKKFGPAVRIAGGPDWEARVTFEDAKAAAQADYNRRVLSALVDPEGGV